MKAPRGSRRRWIIGTAFAALLIALIVSASRFVWLPSSQKANQQVLLQLYGKIDPAQKKEDVTAILKVPPESFQLIRSADDTRWEIAAPVELFASHWYLIVTFRNDQVAEVAIRTADGPPPAGGPPDKRR